jgi:hypothetical protein
VRIKFLLALRNHLIILKILPGTLFKELVTAYRNDSKNFYKTA